MQKWFSDVHLRMNVSLYASLIWNVAFAIFQLALGFYHQSFWFYSMFAYYIILGLMRFFLVKHIRKYKAKEQINIEIKKSILCGWLLIAMNLALAVIVVFIVYLNKTFNHHMITTIAMAAYTFVTFAFAIVNIVRYRKYKSPVYTSAKIITLIAAAVSMLTLETTMLTTFGSSESPLFSQIMLSLTGLAVISFAITMAIIMIVKGYKQLKNKTTALKVLRSRLLEMKQQEERDKYAANRREQIGSGDRSERIRTYNYPQSRITDHRIGMTIHSLPQFMDGEISDMIQALEEADYVQKIQALTEK